jgi:hypothetical protein
VAEGPEDPALPVHEQPAFGQTEAAHAMHRQRCLAMPPPEANWVAACLDLGPMPRATSPRCRRRCSPAAGVRSLLSAAGPWRRRAAAERAAALPPKELAAERAGNPGCEVTDIFAISLQEIAKFGDS